MKILTKIWHIIRIFRIEDGIIKTGSTKPKKEITINITKKHLYFSGVLLLIFMSFFWYGIIDNSWLFTEKTYVMCTDGSKEVYIENKTEYCGEDINNYYARKENEYNNLTGEIFNGIQ